MIEKQDKRIKHCQKNLTSQKVSKLAAMFTTQKQQFPILSEHLFMSTAPQTRTDGTHVLKRRTRDKCRKKNIGDKRVSLC